MKRLMWFLLVLGALLLAPGEVVAGESPAGGPQVTHKLLVVEQTKTLLSDLAAYGKYILPGVALTFFLWGALLRAMAGDDEMKRAKADRTLANAKLGLILGLVATPVLYWVQQYYS